MNNDLISREALKKDIETWGCNDYDKYDFLEAIDNAPTVEAYTEEQVKELVELNKKLSEERPQGEWNYIQAGMCVCPFCGAMPHKEYKNFCAKCGARMRPKPNQLRDCKNCVHHSDNGCEVWKCEFKRRSS